MEMPLHSAEQGMSILCDIAVAGDRVFAGMPAISCRQLQTRWCSDLA